MGIKDYFGEARAIHVENPGLGGIAPTINALFGSFVVFFNDMHVNILMRRSLATLVPAGLFWADQALDDQGCVAARTQTKIQSQGRLPPEALIIDYL